MTTRMPGRARARAARGFSLTELLVVSGVTAMLTVIGLGGFRWAQTRAGTGVSMGNIRQLIAANFAYAADHGGTYCPAMEPDNLIRWHGGRRSVADAFEQKRGFLGPYLGEDGRIGMCPLLSRKVDNPSSWERGAGGYGYNAFYIGGQPGNPWQPAHVTDTQGGGLTVMFATTALAKSGGLQEYPFAEPFFWPRTSKDKGGGGMQPSVHFRANGKAIVGWTGGRITLEPPSHFSDTNHYGGDNRKEGIGWFGPRDENGYWNPDSPASLGRQVVRPWDDSDEEGSTNESDRPELGNP